MKLEITSDSTTPRQRCRRIRGAAGAAVSKAALFCTMRRMRFRLSVCGGVQKNWRGWFFLLRLSRRKSLASLVPHHGLGTGCRHDLQSSQPQTGTAGGGTIKGPPCPMTTGQFQQQQPTSRRAAAHSNSLARPGRQLLSRPSRFPEAALVLVRAWRHGRSLLAANQGARMPRSTA